MKSELLAGAVVIFLPLFLYLSGKRSDRRHEAWRAQHGYPPYRQKDDDG